MLGVGRTSVLAQPEIPLGESQATRFAELVERRATGEPVAYIRGIKEFYGLALAVDARALIPRPETETLVGIALDRVQEALVATPRPPGTRPLVVWEIGTGSGAIAVALAVEFRRRGYSRDVRIRATDSAPEALSLAVENAVAHGVADVIEFATADLADLADADDDPTAAPAAVVAAVEENLDGEAARYADLVVANLPYVPSGTVPELPVAASFEPRAALDGGVDGLEVIGRLLDRLPAVLAPAGVALLEIGSNQLEGLERRVNASLPGWMLTVHHDLSRSPRVAELRRGGAR